ncbi:MAG: hypothetical protein CMQ53_03565 [Gammaproteobacteria bacterium]|nr:hypothetical protein [Gammaproteobacteria bacterium]
MVYKFILRKVNLLIIILLMCLSNNYAFSKIIYDKNNIIISNIELTQYRDLYYQANKKKLKEDNAIKRLVLLKKTINRLEINEPEVIKNLDKIILDEFGKDVFKNKMRLDFTRYFKIRNEFIIDYYKNKLNVNDFKKIVSSFSNFNIPISNNNCLTIIKVINIKEDENFVENLYESFLSKQKNIEITIDKKKYNVCINDNDYKVIENQLIKYIELNTLDEFNKFIYED